MFIFEYSILLKLNKMEEFENDLYTMGKVSISNNINNGKTKLFFNIEEAKKEALKIRTYFYIAYRYIKNEDGFQLNTHVGFVENRAIFWDSRAWHSPLNFAANDKSKRFSILAQYKEAK